MQTLRQSLSGLIWIDLDQQWDARVNRSTEHTAGTRAVKVRPRALKLQAAGVCMDSDLLRPATPVTPGEGARDRIATQIRAFSASAFL